MGRSRIKNRIMLTIAALLLAVFAVAAIPMDAHAEDSADHSWNVKSVQFIPASPTVDMSKIMERDNDGIYALNLANRYKSGFNNCFFTTGDKCVVTYNDNSTKIFTFSRIRGIAYAEFKASDGEVINLEALDTDNAKELKQSGEVSVDELAAIIGENGVNIEYGEYWEEGEEIVGHCVRTNTDITVAENKTHDHKTAIRTRNEAAAQCEATGMTRRCEYCQVCGRYFADTEATQELNKADLIIPMLGHDWSGWQEVVGDPQKEERSCSRCSETETRIIPPDTHTHIPSTDQYRTKPQCVRSGIDLHYICTDCGGLLVKDETGNYVQVEESALRVPATGHRKGNPTQGKVKDPTCSMVGGYNLDYYCEKCGIHLAQERVVIPADPDAHSWGEWTKLDDDQHQRVCGNDAEHVQKEDHNWGDGAVTTAATCTSDGVRTYTCSVCGATKTEVIPAGHTWGEWTKLDDDQHQRVCGNDAEHVQKEDHNWGDGVVTTPASETADGVKTYTCSVCNATKTEVIPSKLKQAKTEAKTELGSYANHADYRDEQKGELAAAIETGNTAIEAAADEAGVATALANAKAAIDKIKTNAQLTAEEEAAKPKTKPERVDLKAVKGLKVKGAKGKLTVKWKKATKKELKTFQGYEIQYTLNGTFTDYPAKKVGKKKASMTLKKLLKKKKYTVRIRRYRDDGSVLHVSNWKVKRAKTK